MKDFLSVICSSQLFSGVTETELAAVLACLDAKKTDFPKEAYLMHTGDTAEAIGFVLSGNVLTVQEDIWGNRHILSKAGSGQTFAAAFACAPGAVLNVSVVACSLVNLLIPTGMDRKNDSSKKDSGCANACHGDVSECQAHSVRVYLCLLPSQPDYPQSFRRAGRQKSDARRKGFSYGAADNKSKDYVLSLRSSAKKRSL